MALENWSKKVIKELVKHAERDQCYSCKCLLVELAQVYGIKYEDFIKNK